MNDDNPSSQDSNGNFKISHHNNLYKLSTPQLWIGNNICATLKDMKAEQKETVKCEDPAVSVGRKIRIEQNNYITLCEVKVFIKSEVEYGEMILS